ncbi:hypothetical protein BC826DRAFT_995913 [Russula brevipes]|nr:hypothetical protein BC826DRAFT_995913 [Russula brevipes]
MLTIISAGCILGGVTLGSVRLEKEGESHIVGQWLFCGGMSAFLSVFTLRNSYTLCYNLIPGVVLYSHTVGGSEYADSKLHSRASSINVGCNA